jgi:N-acetylneuraminic acid mutarotase
MKNIISIYVICSLISFSSIYAQEVWTRLADFGGTARYGAVVFVIGEKSYIVTGVGHSEYHKDIWEYDPATDVWTQRADFGGEERAFAFGFSIRDKGYVGTGMGGDGGALNDFWEYNPVSNTWMQKADFDGGKRINAVAFSTGDKGYVGMGYVQEKLENDLLFENKKDFWEYDPNTDTWNKKTNINRSYDAIGFSINSKGYIVFLEYNELWEYDTLNDSWTKKADFAGAKRYSAIGFSIGNKGYVGIGDFPPNKDFWEYDPSQDTWTRLADFGGVGSFGAVGFSIGHKGYVATGGYFDDEWDVIVLSDFWVYDPSKDIYPRTPELVYPQDAAISVSNENVGMKWVKQANAEFYHLQVSTDNNFASTLVNEDNLIESVYTNALLDFNTTYYWRLRARNEAGESDWSETWSFTIAEENIPWTRKADFSKMSRTGAVGFSIGDKGYVGTGGASGREFNDFWEYDPSQDTWTQLADFGGVGREDAVGFSIGDKGYIGTGCYIDEGWQMLSDFWQYDSQSNIWIQIADFPGMARRNAVGFSIGDKGYVGTGGAGVDLGPWFEDFWEYVPETDRWEQKVDFPGERRDGSVGFSINDRGYIGTGYGDGKVYKDFWEYNPSDNNWTRKADFAGGARSNAVSFVIDGKGYVGTGYNNDFWEYAPQTDTWQGKADFGRVERIHAVGFSIRNKGYVAAPTTDGRMDFWEYDPGKDVISGIHQRNVMISEFQLFQNYPNPFNPSTTISYAVPERGHVHLTIYNIAGQRVATLVNEEQHAQFYEVTFDASNLPSGMYIYRLQVGSFVDTKRMIFIK